MYVLYERLCADGVYISVTWLLLAFSVPSVTLESLSAGCVFFTAKG